MKEQYRHGDLLLESCESIPEGAKEKGDGVLLEGEITGHAHRVGVGGKVYTVAGKTFLYVGGKVAPLTHEEHKTIEIPKGTYKVIRQREYDPYKGIRNVQD